MWIINERGEQVFAQGQSAWAAAAQQANLCPAFKADDEDEWVADQAISCYNCAYRRWTQDSFVCCKPSLRDKSSA
ncbi:MAG: hypothetical protein ACOX0N_09330 [Syntrophomonadaceae bacterium]|jgi:hypothetical protein|nr:hypothetical protein [Syntrophomonadaceae bacterium]